MDNKSHKNNLEEFFRKSFDELSNQPSEDGWDVPSDGVWDNIAAGLNDSKGRPVFFFRIKWLLAAALFIFPATFYQLGQDHQTLNHQAKEQALALETQTQNPERQFLESTTTTSEIKSDNELLVIVPGHNNQQLRKMSIPSEKAKEEKEKKTGQQAVTKKAQTEGAQADATVHIKEFSFLPGIWNELDRAKINELSLAVNEQLTQNKSPRFYIGVYLSPNYAFRAINTKTSSHTDLPLFRKKESAVLSNESGFKAGLRISPRWSVQTGLSFYTIKQSSRQVFRIDFRPDRETQVNDHEFESTYALSVPSAYGNSDLEVDVSRGSNQHFTSGEAILLDVRTRQQLDFISIPLLTYYHFGKGRLNLSIKGGLAVNFLNTKTFESSIRTRRNGLMAKRVRLTREFNETRNTSFDYLLGLGFNYRINRGLSLAFEPTFRHNLTAIAQNKHFKTKAYALGLHLGMYYHL